MRISSAIMVAALTAGSVAAAEFHVAPAGNDANAGTKSKPFATLERARDAARQAKGSTVILAEGTYRLTKTLALDERDSDTTYRGVNALITGSVSIPNSAVKPVTDPAVRARLIPDVKDKVREIDLKSLGVMDFGDLGPRGFGHPYIPASLELFVDAEPLRIAQWPNPDTLGEPIGKIIDMGPVTRNGERPTRGGIFTFKTDRPSLWTQARDIWITGLFHNGFADDTVQVKAFDLEKKTLSTIQPHMYGFSAGAPWNRWVALNLLEEIDLPGEFMADKTSGKLYFLPPEGADLANAKLEVSVLKEPLVAIEGATGVVFDGFTFENSRGMGVYIDRGATNRIQNCTLRNLGMVAVCIGKGWDNFTGEPVSRELGSLHAHLSDNTCYDRDAGTGQGVVNCHIYNIGAGGVSLGGGDRKTLTPAGNFVENCHIHHYNRWDRTYKAAVNIDGVGNRVSHCLIHDAPAVAYYLHGNDHIFEYNEVHHVMMEGDDMGAFIMGRDLTARGHVFRYNYWHDLALRHMTMCLYFDDLTGGGSAIYGNIFCRAGNAATIFINHGSYLTITNNVFIDCPVPYVVNNLNERWISGNIATFEKRLKAVGYDRSPWKELYPELLNYKAFFAPKKSDEMPIHNLFARNLIVESVRKPHQFRKLKLTERDNLRVKADPGFVDMAKGDYRLKPNSDVFKTIPGFEPIPFEKIGLIK